MPHVLRNDDRWQKCSISLHSQIKMGLMKSPFCVSLIITSDAIGRFLLKSVGGIPLKVTLMLKYIIL
jgi:hypothetical protein